MLKHIFTRVFGSRNDRLIKRYHKIVEQINALEPALTALSDAQLKAKTDEFRQRLDDGVDVQTLLPEAFAVVREAARRVHDMRHFDVQLIGGMVLNDGNIAEMRTGEGKTLVATLAAYLNALPGHGVHIVTVNDYLARRDAQWMGKIYAFLGMSTGVIASGLDPQARRDAYACDITYATNNELGFDYLRDNMAFSPEGMAQRGQRFAIVDEVDSILIDEARTPLIISGPAEGKTDLYQAANQLPPLLAKQDKEDKELAEIVDNGGSVAASDYGDYTVDEKARQIYLTERGHERAEQLFVERGWLAAGESLYDAGNIALMHHAYAALRAHTLFQKNVHYIVKGGEVIIVDEFTGRTMPGRRWSDGLHQAIEAKEGVTIQQENQTLAAITFQNYFRLYDKLSGMTGTADTEAFEFQQIYDLEVVVIPTHQPMVRDDQTDLVLLTQDEKYQAIVEDIQDCVQRGQPVLVGTASIEASERLSGLLGQAAIAHEVLNAKQHEREAHIIAQAGRAGAVTIATNMAGRGTDIVLGGSLDADLDALGEAADADRQAAVRADWQQRHDQVLANGGLHVIGSERHESRRVDNQLRGRSGRQGDPGSSRFYLSLEDSLMRIFASERVSGLMQKLGMEAGEAIEHPWVNKAIENAQRKVEAHNFDIRKNVLEYDDVANDQRKVVYAQRQELMAAEDISETIDSIRSDVISGVVAAYIPPGSIDELWDVAGLEQALKTDFDQALPIGQWLRDDDALYEETLRQKILDHITAVHQDKETQVGAQAMRRLEKELMLMVLDNLWKEHLASMDYLRQSIGLRGYAQKQPKQEYKREAFEMFQQLLERIKHDVITLLTKLRIQQPDDVNAIEAQRRADESALAFRHPSAETPAPSADPATAAPPPSGAPGAERQPFRRNQKKVGRNDPCPCGSGKKYKQCHGKLE